MSSNRLPYDTCAYKTALKQSTDQLSHIIEPNRYYHCNQCRNELGLIGGNNVSQIRGNLVDLENDLRGTTRNASLCPKSIISLHAKIQLIVNQKVLIYRTNVKEVPKRSILSHFTFLHAK